jgi:hypothetical protein
MSWVAAAVAGGTLVGGYLSSNAQKDAANTAAGAQTAASQAGIEEQRRQFDQIQKLLSPFVTAGTGALGAQQNLLGTNGAAAQQAAISGIQTSPQYQALSQSGQDAILANASATGGLRGGNVQAALGEFQPQLLAQLIDQQYSRLGGMAKLGQNSAAGVGDAGLQVGNQITKLLGEQGSAASGAALAAGRADSQFINSATNAFGTFMGSKF